MGREGERVTVVGWGNTEVTPILGSLNVITGVSSSLSHILKKLDINQYSQQKCQDIFSPLGIVIGNVNLCAASSEGDACKGDSGGGLLKQSRRGGFYELIGVVSFGVGCRSTRN